MNTLDMGLGWMFAAIAALFTLGLMPLFARRFYPDSSGLLRRLAAPVIFLLLAVACFTGMALQALSLVVVFGLALIAMSRRKSRKSPPLS